MKRIGTGLLLLVILGGVDDLIEGLPRRASLRHGGAHRLDVERLLPQRRVDLVLRGVILPLRVVDQLAVGVNLAAQ